MYRPNWTVGFLQTAWCNVFSLIKMDSHVLFCQCAQRMYLLKLLSRKAISSSQLSVITCSIIISRILYALPVWEGFLSTESIGKINASNVLHVLITQTESLLYLTYFVILTVGFLSKFVHLLTAYIVSCHLLTVLIISDVVAVLSSFLLILPNSIKSLS